MGNYSVTNLKDFGYLRIAGAIPEIKVADPDYNLKQHLQLIDLAAQEHIELLVFPDFSLSGVTCRDLFKENILLEKIQLALQEIRSALSKTDLNLMLTVPEKINGLLMKVLYFFTDNEVASYIVPVSNNSELSKNFATDSQIKECYLTGYQILNSQNVFLLKNNKSQLKFTLGVYQSLNDLYQNYSDKGLPPNINVVMSSSPELIDSQTKIESGIAAFAELMQTGVVFLSPGYGESTTDHVYSGRSYIYEQSYKLAETTLYEPDLMIADLDLQILANQSAEFGSKERTCSVENPILTLNLKEKSDQTKNSFRFGSIESKPKSSEFYRKFPENPFLPQDKNQEKVFFDSILTMAAQGLRKRLQHINSPKVLLGLSGGLDSTLALLIALRTQKLLNKSNQNILCVSMPGFGTTKRTYNNTKNLAEACGTSYLEIPIHDVVKQHFKDINHDPEIHDITFENAQARERTQILMDLANKEGGIVLGTGDLSESALGFVTYGGDHLSMYQINAGIPKTLIRHLVEFEAKKFMLKKMKNTVGNPLSEKDPAKILFDILATPVSPELLPPKDGQIAQQTEHIVGPYELHDLFLYYFINYNFAPKKILFIAEQTFPDKYDHETIIKWLKLFYKRFFANQFKRSATPDGPNISKVSLSPRYGFAIPSDAVAKLWLEDLETML